MLASTVAGQNTYDEFWVALVWSFENLETGRWPYRNHKKKPYRKDSVEGTRAGKLFAGGYFPVLWKGIGDLDYFYQCLHLRRYNAAMPCSWCAAGAAGVPWNDYKVNITAWMSRIYTSNRFAELFPNLHRLFELKGFSIYAFGPDHMHCKYLGSINTF